MLDLNTCECIKTFIGHEEIVWCIENLLYDKIVSCSRDKTIRMWNLNTGECFKMLRGHETEIFTKNVISNEKIIS